MNAERMLEHLNRYNLALSPCYCNGIKSWNAMSYGDKSQLGFGPTPVDAVENWWKKYGKQEELPTALDTLKKIYAEASCVGPNRYAITAVTMQLIQLVIAGERERSRE